MLAFFKKVVTMVLFYFSGLESVQEASKDLYWPATF
jgi:hypothetical protein